MRLRKNGARSYSAATEKSKTNKLAVTKGKSIAPGRLAFFYDFEFRLSDVGYGFGVLFGKLLAIRW
jgi:hypothetical protein